MEAPKFEKQEIATCAACQLLVAGTIAFVSYPCVVVYAAAAM